ncbi:MAG: GNAT family N-acetyltransferase [Desulfobacterales bacterium]|nr:GNAT family N-acetyltransferase [Desulfobacterales bacterium]
MKRLFVRPAYRGYGIGRLLAERLLAEGRALGYRAMRLDTLDRLGEAVALYRTLGFRTIPLLREPPARGDVLGEGTAAGARDGPPDGHQPKGNAPGAPEKDFPFSSTPGGKR